THAATHLDAQRALRGEPHDRRSIGEHAILRAVEVDDVQPGGAEPAVTLMQIERIVFVARLRVEVALEQANTAAIAQVNCRNQKHQLNLRKLASTREPGREERSGWNCAPQKLPRRTIAETGMP